MGHGNRDCSAIRSKWRHSMARRWAFHSLVKASHPSRMMWTVGTTLLIFASCVLGHGRTYASSNTAIFFVDSTGALRNYNVHRYHHPRMKAPKALQASSVPQDALRNSQPKPPLPPEDETFSSPIAALKELLAAPSLPSGSARYDEIGLKTGGIWRSKRMGIFPSTLLAAQSTTPWLAKEEAIGNVFSTWPLSVMMLLGHKSVTTLGQQPNVHAAVRSVFTDSLSPVAVAKLGPFIDSCLERQVPRWDKFASSGKTLKMFDEISSFTFEVITYSFLGDYGTGEVLKKLQRIIPAVSGGLLSKPRRFPWPLNQMPGHNYGKAIDARKEFDAEVGDILRQRRLDLAAEAHGKAGANRTAGVLDKMLAVQAEQVRTGGSIDEEYDDALILDNMCTALFAGYETTSVTISRMLQFLASEDSRNQGVVEKLIEELNTADIVLQEYLTERESTGSSEYKKTGPTDIMKNFPLLQAVMHESNRLSPAASGVFRVAGKDLELNGFLIPKGETISWNLTNGNKAESLYPEPARFCPFRFFHGGNDQPPPLMFGFGRHACPGRELAKIEIILFMETFLRKYTYRLVKKQNLKGKFPTNAPKGRLKMVLAHADT